MLMVMMVIMVMTVMMMVTMETYLTAFDEVDTVVLDVEPNKVAAKNSLVTKRMNR